MDKIIELRPCRMKLEPCWDSPQDSKKDILEVFPTFQSRESNHTDDITVHVREKGKWVWKKLSQL